MADLDLEAMRQLRDRFPGSWDEAVPRPVEVFLRDNAEAVMAHLTAYQEFVEAVREVGPLAAKGMDEVHVWTRRESKLAHAINTALATLADRLGE